LSDVAASAGVSMSTASRALNSSGYVAAAVKVRVLDAAETLGYVPNEHARSLKAQQSTTVGLLVSDLRNRFYADVAAGAANVLREHGYMVVLVDDAASDKEELAAARTFLAARVAGVLLTPVSGAATKLVRQHGLPVVEVDRQFSRGCDAVLIDNVAAAREMTRYLIDLGHRRIALLIDETDWTTGGGRLDGFYQAHRDAGLEVDEGLVVRAGFDTDEVSQRARDLLTARRRPTALFAANNLLAELAWREVTEAGLRIPADLSLVGFDDAPWMSMVIPGITTVSQPAFELGSRAARVLLQRIEKPARARTVQLDSELIERGSTAKRRRR
jgi:LacI family transcriptional regulator